VKVLFDQGTPVPLRRYLRAHEVTTVYELGWSSLQNGSLISQAETAGFDMLVTTDQNWKYQQNLSERSLAVVVLLSTSWPKIQAKVSEVVVAVDGATKGSYAEVPI
jgi:hypothetical protein